MHSGQLHSHHVLTQLARAFIASAAQGALCDDDAGVRTAAGGVFNVLFKSGGGSAMDSVIPALLSGLDSEAHSAQVGDCGDCMAGQAGDAGLPASTWQSSTLDWQRGRSLARAATHHHLLS